jgi:acyl phosphate:glycerol-3-phosphate acyltransferase
VTALVLVGAYLIGSIPFSFLVARLWGIGDVRQVGSGNVGATNVMRNAGWRPGLLALLLDATKGAVAAVLATRIGGPDLLPPLAAVAAVVGHLFPPWLRFRGGKGVATGAGAFVPIAPTAVLGALVVFGAVAGATRYVSLGSVCGAAALAALLFAFEGRGPVAAAGLVVALLVVAKHRDNLARLLRGNERRLGSRPS